MAVLVLSVISLITTCFGLWYVGEKEAVGFMLYNISLICQGIIFTGEKKWFLVIQMLVLIGFNIFNYIKWT